MEIASGPNRVAELHVRLIDETDRLRRAGIHLELATIALGEGQFDHASRHFREALLLDASLERARTGLEHLGQRADAAAERRTGAIRRFIGRLRR